MRIDLHLRFSIAAGISCRYIFYNMQIHLYTIEIVKIFCNIIDEFRPTRYNKLTERNGGVELSDFFMNDKYKVLVCMAKCQVLVGNDMMVKLSQQEIADTLSFTKTKANSIMRELKENGYIQQLSPRGKYVLTSKANTELIGIREMGGAQ